MEANTSNVNEVVETNKKTPKWYALAWSSRSISLAATVIILNQITFYSTEVLGLNVGVVGTLFLVAKIFDAIADFFIGNFIDKHNFKKGKARPYEVLIIPLWIMIVLLFSAPDFGNVGKLIYILIIFVLISSIGQSMLQATDTIYLGRAVASETERGKILSISGVFVMFVSAMVSMSLPNLMVKFGSQAHGWTKISLIYAIPMIILGMVRYFTIKERKVVQKDHVEDHNFKDNLKIMFQNKYIFILCGIILLANAVQNTMSMVGTYYFTYIMGNLGLFGMVGLLGLVSPLILLLFPVAIRKIGSLGFLKIGLSVSILASVIRFIFPTSFPVVLVTVMLTGIGASFVTMLNSYFILQCIEYGEVKHGRRIEGLPTALASFMTNLGQGVSGAVVGLVMSLAGYAAANAQQTEAALFSIRSLYSFIPAIMGIVMIILLQFFDVEKQLHQLKANKQ
ncbi:hypothetical protein BAU15_00950 [Enterococcus sp. JM4C]|uniref:glycoside-pentoside-hexuronide (GPH):cation symporter n=1 Tax=Candidatus Enterococcus huntleyi TaxID=1857217 RepID=UPI00137A9F62|nr:glycoside-pentoside-hexuronide (GPH):cation symporter [Enterococcus sp. JM4C]KAF1299245.1 hypothetical protein BAU15_00950 [Enterococcus sp. JM4C]